MKYLSECDVLIYDLHSGNPKDVELALDGNSQLHKLLALKKYNIEEEKVLMAENPVCIFRLTCKKKICLLKLLLTPRFWKI